MKLKKQSLLFRTNPYGFGDEEALMQGATEGRNIKLP